MINSKIVITEQKALSLVKNHLIEIGYNPDIEIKKYAFSNKVEYYIYDKINYHHQLTKTLTILNCQKINEILKLILENDYEELKIIPIIKSNNRVLYSISYNNIKNNQLRKSRYYG